MSSVSFLYPPASRKQLLILFPPSSSFTSNSLCLLPAASNLKANKSRRSSLFCFYSKSDANSHNSTTTTPTPTPKAQPQRPPFDINLAVILAGFAFEAYTTPPDSIGVKEIDAAGCLTVYLSQSFLREIYDGQLFVKLKKGVGLPAMDPWGTSDPYVVLQLDAQVVKSKVKWGSKDPTWNEEFTINIKKDPTKNLQVAAWDANLVTPHKRMGNGRINLEEVFDGDSHEVVVELEGIGGGGKILLEIKYRSFHDIDEGKKWWEVPFISDFLRKNGMASALAAVIGPESIPAGQFVQYAFGKLKSFSDDRLLKDHKGPSKNDDHDMDIESNHQLNSQSLPSEIESDVFSADTNSVGAEDIPLLGAHEKTNEQQSNFATQFDAAMHSDFWKKFSDVISQNVVQRLGLPAPENLKWDGFELLNNIGLQSKKIAEAGYVDSGLATPDDPDTSNADESGGAIKIGNIQPSLPDIKKTMQEVLRQTDSVFGALIVLAAEKPKSNEKSVENENRDVSIEKVDQAPEYSKTALLSAVTEGVQLDEKKAEEMKALFSTAETAMEAWALLASAVGHPSFVKSEFEKVCFLDNSSTDTQVALWRDSARRRLVVAFRGTEQARWKDLMTDLMLVPAGLNPERIGGEFKEEVQVHSGFLGAYDSVRTRLISLIKLSIGFDDNDVKQEHSWKVYVTGHSLGGALATLLALELSSSRLAKRGAISVTMYNFGSPRVGNRQFAQVYNERVIDSWRVVNHRDIIPTVPRLMGYCHVAQPVYLATGGLKNSMENAELLEDNYLIDVAGEYTPDALVNEFMKGEKELVEKILQTEINLFRSIRDGSALMQHMEDFYYITLLENVRSNYRTVPQPWSDKGDRQSI